MLAVRIPPSRKKSLMFAYKARQVPFHGHFPNITTTARGRGSGMRAGCSASTFILVAAWEQSLHPGGPGHRFAKPVF